MSALSVHPAEEVATRPTGRPALVAHIPGLDGMRALAVVAVVVYHANPSWLPGGFLGVEIFFVVSGYLITLLLVAERERDGRITLQQFWLRRARRLLPALIVMLLAVVVVTSTLRRDALGQLRGDVIAALLYMSNWHQIWSGHAYTAAGEFAPLRHLWSLAVEEQFYLAWPLVLVVLMRRRSPSDVACLLALGAVGIALAVAAMHPRGPLGSCPETPDAYWHLGHRCLSKLNAIYLASPTRAGGLLIGASLAMVWRPATVEHGAFHDRHELLDLCALLAALLLTVTVAMVHIVTPEGRADAVLFNGGLLLVSVATAAVIAAVTHPGTITSRVLGVAAFRWIGVRSYGIYLFHWPVFQVARRAAGVPLTIPQFMSAMTVTALITECCFRWVETPVRHGELGRRWRRARASAVPAVRHASVLGMSVVIVAALFGVTSVVTARERQDPITESLQSGAAFVEDPLATAASSLPTPVPPAQAEPATPPSESISRYALGDSVMLGAAEQLSAAGFIVDAMESRAFINGLDRVQRLAAEGRLSDVVVVHLGTNGTVSAAELEAMTAALAHVARVVFVTVKADRPWVPATNERLRALPLRHPNVVVVDWASLAGQCPGHCFYDDGIHLRPEARAFYTELIIAASG
jgi:peptidoglycan/LPS O-acetylase OafA/YrhL